VRSFLNFNGFQFIGRSEAEYALVKRAYATFGKGWHAAGLNMGDCFACAQAHSATLLFKGEDFAKTDIHAA
jgi:ribonuclease VapC